MSDQIASLDVSKLDAPTSDPLTPTAISAKRGWQTLIQGLGIDVLVAVALVVMSYLPALDSWDALGLRWAAISFAVSKSVMQALVAYVVRRWFDRSGYSNPEPLPDGPAYEAKRALPE